MPIILVVDDSETERKMMTHLLGADVDWLVASAADGQEALELISATTPDAVVTDMVMPGMDGMELVSRLAETFPELPVVLVAGHDDARLALRALRKGAASYVPKAELKERLLDTVEQVLAVRDADHHDDRIVQITTNTRYRFVLNNDPTLIPPLVDRVQAGMIGMQLCSPAQRMHIGIALEEALINAMYHGNLELPPHKLPEIRQLLHQGQPSELISDRREQSPYKERRIQVAADFTRGRAQVVVRDDGTGFDVGASLPKSVDEIMDGEGHRGLSLIRAFMDEVSFNEKGNELRMILNDLRSGSE